MRLLKILFNSNICYRNISWIHLHKQLEIYFDNAVIAKWSLFLGATSLLSKLFGASIDARLM